MSFIVKIKNIAWIYLVILFFKDTRLLFSFFKAKKVINSKLKFADVLFVFPHYHVGGAEKVHYRVSKVAKEVGLRPLFIFTGISKSDVYLKNFEDLGNIIDIGFRYQSLKINNLLLEYVIRKVNKAQLKIVFGSNSRMFYEIAAGIQNLPIIDLTHTYNPPYEMSNVVFDYTFSKFRSRIFINQYSLSNMMEYYKVNLNTLNSNNFNLIYNAPFEASVEPDFPFKKEPLFPMQVLFVSRNSEEKRPSVAFNVAKKITQKFPGKFSFKMVGDFESFAKEYSSEDIEIIANLKDSDQIIPYYKSSHCLILTSITEGFPLVISEAMFYNTFPVSTDVGGISEIIVNNKNGILISNELSELQIEDAFVESLINLSNDSTLFEALSANSFKTAKSHFSNSIFTNKYKAVFQDL